MSDEVDLDAYCARIGYAGSREPGESVLHALHYAHARAIPFENLDILLGRPLSLNLADLQQKLVRARRGGYCFEQNALFAAILRAMGFEVTTLLARVRFGIPAEQQTPRTHMVLRVDTDGGPWLADVGFGGLGLTVPLRMEPDAVQPSHLETYRLVVDDADPSQARPHAWRLQALLASNWADVYTFTLEPQFPVDFEVANHFTATHPRSHFTQMIVCALPSGDCRYVLRGPELGVRRAGVVERTPIGDPDEVLEVLAKHFGLFFPPGTRFTPRTT